ncbi:MAG TPA: histidine kinase dimerization/phospho-acceptor domain-containing protein, partial [Anaeromyxobacteraceae bacterium]|nr:histidine kinase dimerization/phospho-acceptor domain-containing protein [Anaeromyxobacteraceae bacterium]
MSRSAIENCTGTFIIRETRVVYASPGATALLGRPSREILGRPFFDFLVPEERPVLRERHARRVRGEAVPSEYETTIVTGDGRTRVVECTVVLDGTDVLLQAKDVSAQAARRPRMAELARLGAELPRERSAEAVFERVREGLFALGLSSFLLAAEPEGVRVVWARLPAELAATFQAWFGRSMLGYVGPWTPFSRAAWQDGISYTDDWILHVSSFIPPGHAEEARALVARQGLSRAVAIRLDERAAARFYLVVVGEWLRSGDVAALRLFGAQVAAALDAAALLEDLRRRVEELDLLHEVGRSLVASLELPEVLEAGVRNLARIVDAPEAYLALARGDAPELEVRAVAGPRTDQVGHRVPIAPAENALAALVFERREPVVVDDAANDPRVPPREFAHGTAFVALPLLGRDRVIGSVLIVETRGPRRFTPPELQRATAVANQLAVAAENARLYEDLRRSYADLAAAQRQLVHSERLAALGELSAVVAHEVRNPLGVIFNSLGTLRRLVPQTGDAKMLLDIVQEESDRLNRIVRDLLDFARPAVPELQPERLDRVLEDAVGAATAGATALTVDWKLDPALPQVPVDSRMVRQAVLNVALNAVQAMPRGGRIAVEARVVDDAVEVVVEDEGPGIPDAHLARIFEPFFTTKATG